MPARRIRAGAALGPAWMKPSQPTVRSEVMTDMPLSRRSLLRGAGALVALPFLESLPGARALAAAPGAVAGKPPLRMGIFTVTGGTVLESWQMPKAGAFGDKLPSILRPLEFAKQDLLLLSNLSHGGKGENVNGHENCAFKHL